MKKHKVILDIDNALSIPVQDVDDGIALFLALTSPEIELIGCTTSAGNCRTNESTLNTLRMLELAGRGDIPVAEGRENPFINDPKLHFQYLKEKSESREKVYWDYLNNPILPSIKKYPLKAHEFIIEKVKKYPNEIIFVAESSFTNLALALLVEPGIAPLIKEVVHMGGSFIPKKSDKNIWKTPDIPDTAWRNILTFNTKFDPESSIIVFKSGIPLTFVTVNVTKDVYLYLDDLEKIKKTGSPFHNYIYETVRPWIKWSMRERKLQGAQMHDPLTLGIVINRNFCKYKKMHLDIGKFKNGSNTWLFDINKKPMINTAVSVNSKKFEKFLVSRLSSTIL